MDTLAGLLVVLLGIVVAVNLAAGTMGGWLKAKFLNRPMSIPKGAAAA